MLNAVLHPAAPSYHLFFTLKIGTLNIGTLKGRLGEIAEVLEVHVCMLHLSNNEEESFCLIPHKQRT